MRSNLTALHSLIFQTYSALTTEIANSSNACGFTKLGASVIKHAAAVVFRGRQLHHECFLVPVKSMVKRSKPNAKPACGGVPNFNASNKKPNFSRCCSSSIPKYGTQFVAFSDQKIRTEPPPTS